MAWWKASDIAKEVVYKALWFLFSKIQSVLHMH